MEGEVLLTDWNLLFQGVLIGASVLPGLRGCKKILFYTYSTFSSSDKLPQYCQDCEVRFACNGECPKHRFTWTPDGEWGLNYLCPAYKKFFKHIDPSMKIMAELIHLKRPAADIMKIK
jgi:sulfatase maturation enzyme AslB (radical SAM superfamily)